MDSNGQNQTPENPEHQTPSEDRQHQQPPPQLSIAPTQNPHRLPIASISLCVSTILPTHFFSPPSKILSLFKAQTTKVKIPNQISSISHLSLTSSLSLSKPFLKSTLSAKPFQSRLFLNPLHPSNPSNAAALRRASIIWFRNDLRVYENEGLNSANNESMSALPVYYFYPRDYGKFSSGFDKTGPYRAIFLLKSVADLRKTLQSKGFDLVVRFGKPKTVVLELAQAAGAEAVYVHREVSHDEVKVEDNIQAILKDEMVEVKYFWGSILYHIDDLPSKLSEMPTNYGGFKEKVQGLDVRKTIEALDQLKGLPARGDVEPGEIPSFG